MSRTRGSLARRGRLGVNDGTLAGQQLCNFYREIASLFDSIESGWFRRIGVIGAHLGLPVNFSNRRLRGGKKQNLGVSAGGCFSFSLDCWSDQKAPRQARPLPER